MGDAKINSVFYSFKNHFVFIIVWMVLFLPSAYHHDSSLVAISGASVNSAMKEIKNDKVFSACLMDGCNCTMAVHYAWRVLNCTFNNTQTVDLVPGSIPDMVQEVNIYGGREVRFSSQVFTPLRELRKVHVEATSKLLVKKHSFVNLTTALLLLEIVECGTVIFETAAFKGIKGPLKGSILRSAYVLIQSNAFSYLLEMKISDVPRLELANESFKFEYPPVGRHGPTTTIHLHKVMMSELPGNTFSTSAAHVWLQHSEIRMVRSHAFSANTLLSIELTNTSLHHVEAQAFKDITLVYSLQLIGCRIRTLESAAIIAGISNLAIHHTRISEVQSGAINIIAANVSLVNCVFDNIHSKGVVIKQWNRVDVVSNTFRHLGIESIDISLEDAPKVDTYEFRFISNEIYSVVPSGLKFIAELSESKNTMLEVTFEMNLFSELCHCDIKTWLGGVLGTTTVSDKLIDTSFCSIKSVLARCFNIMEGLINMKNFTDLVCNSEKQINCPSPNDEKIGVIETVTKEFSAHNNNNSDSNSTTTNNHWILVLILSLVVLIATCGAIIMLLIKGGLWLKRKGYCVRFRGFEYSANDEIGTTEAEDIMVTVENKMNESENLPSELTPELLQTLREKLEDPATYNEAREMIERLYDHFLVEETYNNNEENEPEEAHLYEELNTRPSAAHTENSPEKVPPARPFSFLRLIEERFNLLPEDETPTRTNPTLIGEYSEPMDAEPNTTRNTDVHVYSELPASAPSGNKEMMASRPLPARPIRKDDAGEGTSFQELRRY